MIGFTAYSGYISPLHIVAKARELCKRAPSALPTLVRNSVLILFVFLSELVPNEVHSSERQAQRVVFAGDIADYYPFHFLDNNGNPNGFDVELFQHIAEKEGWTPEFQFHDWNTSQKLLESGDVDLIPMFYSTARAEKYLFSIPILSRAHLIFGRKGSDFIDSIEALASRRVAVQYASMTWEEVNARIPSAMIIPVSMESAAITAIVRGNADYAIIPSHVGYRMINQNGLEDIVAVSPPVLERYYAFAISRARPDLLPKINTQLRQLQTNGAQGELYMKWLANVIPSAQSYRSGLMVGLWIALPLLLTSTLGWLWWRRAHRRSVVLRQRAKKEAKMRRLAQEEVQFLAFRDPTTGLPNRNALHDRLSDVIEQAALQSSRCALMRIDLKNLDLIQTIAGQGLSDEVVRNVAGRLSAQWGEDNVAHLGDGQFSVVLQGDNNNKSFDYVLSTAMALVQQRIDSEDLALVLDGRAGLAQFPTHGSTATEILRAAEMACRAARTPHSQTRVYESNLEPDPRNLTLLGDLRQAILSGTLDYALQPKLCLVTKHIIGAEMLVRWDHPKYGPLLPGIFVPLAEQTGFISTMTLYLIRRALVHCREWQQLGYNLHLSVNVSVNDLAAPGLVDAIISDAKGLGRMLILEVTETDVMQDAEEVLRSVNRLRQQGVRISLDDFGTGHASFTYLQRMSPDEIKIDRSFVTHLLHSASDQAIVRTILQLAHDLGAMVTAEGIEDEHTLQWLVEAGCDLAQGFGIARPMPASQFMNSKLLFQPQLV